MKRSPKSEFDDAGMKWFESPLHKEVKTDKSHPDGASINEQDTLSEDAESNFSKDDKESNLRTVKEKFYDFLNTITKYPELKLDFNYLNQNINAKIDKILDMPSISEIFEKLCIKVLSNPRIKKNWSEEEASLFLWVVLHYCHIKQKDFTCLEDSDWIYIGNVIPGKKSEQCKYKWQSLLKVNLSKVPWTQKEDDILISIINEKGTKQWKNIAKELNARTGFKHYRHGKQCRERWINHLDPTIIRGFWSIEEDIQLLKLQLEMGKKWADIAKILGSRTENAVKNRWNSLIKKHRNDLGLEENFLASQTPNVTSEELEHHLSLLLIEAKTNELNLEGEKNKLKLLEETSLTKILNDENYISSQEANENPSDEKSEKSHVPNKKKPRKNLNVDKSKNLLKDLVYQERQVINNTSSGQPPAKDGVNTTISNNSFNVNNTTISNNSFNVNNTTQSNPMTYLPFSINNLTSGNSQIRSQVSDISSEIFPNHSNPLINTISNSYNPQNISNSNSPYQMHNIKHFNDALNWNRLLMNSNNQINQSSNIPINSQANLIQNQGASITNEKSRSGTSVNQISTSGLHSGFAKIPMVTSFFNDDQLKKSSDFLDIESKIEESMPTKTSLSTDFGDKSQCILFKQVPYNEFRISESSITNNQAFYAMVDLYNKQICYVAPIKKETAPGWMLQNKIQNQSPSSNFNIGTGPQASPLFSPNLFNSPLVLLNHPSLASLANLSIPIKTMNKEVNNDNSPNISGYAGANSKNEIISSNDWTPEMESQKLFPKMNIHEKLLNYGSDYRLTDANSVRRINSGNVFQNQPQLQNIMNQEELMRSMGLSGIDIRTFKNTDNNVLFDKLRIQDSPPIFLNTSNRKFPQ